MHGGRRGEDVKGSTGSFEPSDPYLQDCFKQEPVIKRFVPTNEEKLLAFYEKQGDTKTPAQVQKMIAKTPLPNIANELQDRFGDAPHLFYDNQLSIDAVADTRIEVLGPESAQ